MFQTLADFYSSKEWVEFRKVVIAERMHEDGFVYDEVTGKPIVKAYDIILHHIEHLTEENVHDYNVSLNPANIQIVAHKTHNLIHNKLGYSKREVYLVYGAPLSGHRAWAIDNMEIGDLVIDIDRIWEAVSGSTIEKPNRIKSQVFRVRDTLIDSVKYRAGKWNNCYIVGGYPMSSERERLVKELGAREIFVEASKEECLARLETIEDGRDKEAWRGYIEEWFERYTRPV